MKKITEQIIREFLREKSDKNLFHREQKDLEFKESFNLAGLAEYFRDFAGFANNSGGYIVFGITDKPKRLKGLLENSLIQFNRIDEEKISGYINEHFAPYIDWESDLIEIDGKFFGVLYAYPGSVKPVICKKGDDRQIIKSGEIYYRYAGRTEVIQYSELINIIENRIKENNNEWLKQVKKIGEVGPKNVGIVDTVKGVYEGDKGTLLIDKELIKDINFIQEGHFHEKYGARTLKLVGTVESINNIEVERVIKQQLLDDYPFSHRGLVEEIRKSASKVTPKIINDIIKKNDLKNDKRYSTYIFRNKNHQVNYNLKGVVPSATPSVFNESAIYFILKIINQK